MLRLLNDWKDKNFNNDFKWSSDRESRETILKSLDSEIKAIPILDKYMRLVDVVTTKSAIFSLAASRTLYVPLIFVSILFIKWIY